MRPGISNDVVKLRMMAAQMRHHAQTARDQAWRAKFARAATELEHKADEAERAGPPLVC